MAAAGVSIRDAILAKNAYSAPYFHNKCWWTRCSAQVWNEVRTKKVNILSKLTQYVGLQVSDFEELGKRWLEVCADIKQQYGFTEKE